MAAPIRPSFPQVPPPAVPRSSETARAAQRAFFDALGKAQAVPTPEPPKVSVAAAPVRSARPADQASSEPDRLLRPGSLLNIRV